MSLDWKYISLEALILKYPRWMKLKDLYEVGKPKGGLGGIVAIGQWTSELAEAGMIDKIKRSNRIWVRLKAWNQEWVRESIPGLDIHVIDATASPIQIGEAIQAKVMMNVGREWCIKRVGSEIWIAAMPATSNVLGENN